ncbi:HVA22-like protein i [Oryza brachyantha]|uniref:HVA22-like protein n=1 Tax=Oryza brachyantha TaxID=4533 RepID=J3LM14_ORYBR|nr:HVA22-like protein i [Oryza brachyantha]
MMGGFLSRVLLLAFGYAYPAYECYKTVELNKPEIEQLIFWCQYWILVALMTVLERFGDFTISWLPFYSEAKLMFFIYLWYPKTKGTTYIYGTFFRPYISQHENEIDRNLLEIRARATDVVVLYFQKAATAGQNTFFDVLKYVASQSPSQKSRQQPSQEPQQPKQQQAPLQQQQQPQKQAPTVMRRSASIAARQAAMAQQSQEAKTVPSSPKIKRQASAKAAPVASTKSTAAAAPSATKPDADSPKKNEATPASLQVRAPATNADAPTSEPSAPLPDAEEADKMAIDEADDAVEGTEEELDPVPGETVEERPMEETIRVTRAKLRRRAAAEDPAGN